jgi:hypothetical protein
MIPNSNHFIKGLNYVFTDGGNYFNPYNHIKIRKIQHIHNEFREIQTVAILASNASIWHIPHYIEQDEESWGFLYQIDHLNGSTGDKVTRVMHCSEIPKGEREEDKNCTTLDEHVNFLYFIMRSEFSL